MNNQRGVLHLALPLVILLIVGAAVFILVSLGVIKNPFSGLKVPGIGQGGPKVEVKKEYENPFKKETQYVNPFENYKNPFEVAK